MSGSELFKFLVTFLSPEVLLPVLGVEKHVRVPFWFVSPFRHIPGWFSCLQHAASGLIHMFNNNRKYAPNDLL